MTMEQTEFLYQVIDKAIDEARRYMPNATDDEILEWVHHIGAYQSLSDELKLALVKEALKPWNMLRMILEAIRRRLK